MTTPEQNRDGLFMRSAAAVGDLDSPFYDEERQRDVWNEASAVGFQLAILLGLAASAGMLWIVGRPALPYAVIVVMVVGIPAAVTLNYARRLGVDTPGWPVVPRWRLALAAVLVLLNIGGVLWAGSSTSSWGGMLTGLGAVVVGAALVAGISAWRKRRAGN